MNRVSTQKTIKLIVVTSITMLLLAIFLSPFLFMVFTSLKTQEQISILGAPIWPAAPAFYEYEGEQLEVFTVPLPDGSTKNLAMLKPGRRESIFVDPNDLEAGEIVWQGSWRSLDRPWQWSPAWGNYVEAWESINFPRLLYNTTMYAVVSNIGVLLSCTLVAYGFPALITPGETSCLLF